MQNVQDKQTLAHEHFVCLIFLLWFRLSPCLWFSFLKDLATGICSIMSILIAFLPPLQCSHKDCWGKHFQNAGIGSPFMCSGVILLQVLAVFLHMKVVSYKTLFILLDNTCKMDLLVTVDLNYPKYVFQLLSQGRCCLFIRQTTFTLWLYLLFCYQDDVFVRQRGSCESRIPGITLSIIPFDRWPQFPLALWLSEFWISPNYYSSSVVPSLRT